MIQRILVVARGEAIKKVDPVTGETIYKYNEVSARSGRKGDVSTNWSSRPHRPRHRR